MKSYVIEEEFFRLKLLPPPVESFFVNTDDAFNEMLTKLTTIHRRKNTMGFDVKVNSTFR